MADSNFLTSSDVVWIVAPHADDEILGAGGLLLQAHEVGAAIFVLYVTVSGYGVVRGGANADLESRMKEVEAVTGMLGVDEYDILFKGEERHLKLDTVPVATLIDWLERGSTFGATQVKPTVALLPSRKHNHQDHRAVHEAGISVFRSNPTNEKQRLAVLAYEVPGTGQLGLEGFDPNVYLELNADDLRQKCLLYEKYASQVSQKPGLRSLHAIEILAQYRGFEAGCDFAEAFELLRLRVRR
jgi:LmbE family N-acetylglucosaminyl deacetylase